MSEDDGYERPDPGMRMVCPTCHGHGLVVRSQLAVAGATGATVDVPVPCPHPQCGHGMMPLSPLR